MHIRKFSHILALTAIASLCGASFGISRAIAEETKNTSELKSKIDTHKDTLGQLNSEIEQLKNQIDSVGKQKKTLQNELISIDLVRKKIQKEAEITRIKALRTTFAISTLERNIKEKQAAIERQKQAVGFALQRIAEADDSSLFETLLGSGSISEAFEESDRFEALQEGFILEMDKLRGLSTDLRTDKKNQEEENKKAKEYSKQLVEKQELVDEKRQERVVLVKETSNKESLFQAQLKEKEKRKKQFELELEAFESALKISVDSTTFPTAGTKALMLPIPGARITQHYGYTAAAKKLYAAGKHTGTDFGVQVGTPVLSAGPGVVEATGDTDIACRGASYGKYVYVRHKNGLATLYAHLSKYSVAPGQEVDTQELLGYSGNTGYSTGPHLHVGLFVASAAKVDNVPSQACPGAVFRMPVAPKEAYLDLENYI